MDVNHFRHLWGEWHAKFVLGFTLDAAGIRAEIANGQFKVVGPTELHGQKAVELEDQRAAQQRSPAPCDSGAAVGGRHDLPADAAVPAHVQWPAERHADYTFLPPTAENLAKLRPVIPAGYTRAGRTQVTGPKPKTIKK